MRTILDLLPQNPEVNQVMVDFEKAMWNYLREVLPDVTVKGCVFHWTQALWRKVSKKNNNSNNNNNNNKNSAGGCYPQRAEVDK